MSNLDLYRIQKDIIRENFNEYTRKAFTSLPKLKNPHILDIGCGSGTPTIELAKMSKGNIIGIDIDEISLDLFQRKIKKSRLNKKISIIKKSITDMDFLEESFDIIWAEGSVFVIGFEKSIKSWHRLLKPSGFLVIHDENTDKNQKLQMIPKSGYKLIDQFEISKEEWLLKYFQPLEEFIQNFRYKYPDDLELNAQLDKDQKDIDEFKSDSMISSSFFIIMQKM